MRHKKCKNTLLIILLAMFVVLLFNSNTAFAAVNEHYIGTDVVTDENLEEAFSESSLLNLLAKLIYAVGRFLEWILGTIFKLLTGSSDFPWADKIVFNSVPLLDVNFINPGAGSFVAQPGIKAVLKNLYATILTLAASFFGIVVLITAIRLVISTIASDKAKYKQAIVDWLIGFVMLFCIHYAISFIFYLNEQLVVVASNIVKTQLQGKNNIANVKADAVAKELIENVKSRKIKYNGQDVANILEANTNILSTWMNALASNDTSKGLQEGLMKKRRWYAFGADVAKNTDGQYETLGMIVSWAASENVSINDLKGIRDNLKVYQYDRTKKGATAKGANQAISTADLEKLFTNKETKKVNTTMKNYFIEHLDTIYYSYEAQQSATDSRVVEGVLGSDTYPIKSDKIKETKKNYYYLSSGVDVFNYESGTQAATTNFYWTKIIDDMITLKGASDTSSGKKVSGSGGSSRLISDLASYFRYNSYSKEARTTNVTGIKDGNNIQIQNMIMYAILVAQSLILFISYIKRLFYVILLAMMAPVVVVFDFFQKFGK